MDSNSNDLCCCLWSSQRKRERERERERDFWTQCAKRAQSVFSASQTSIQGYCDVRPSWVTLLRALTKWMENVKPCVCVLMIACYRLCVGPERLCLSFFFFILPHPVSSYYHSLSCLSVAWLICTTCLRTNRYLLRKTVANISPVQQNTRWVWVCI